jgi:hypothetical protein
MVPRTDSGIPSPAGMAMFSSERRLAEHGSATRNSILTLETNTITLDLISNHPLSVLELFPKTVSTMFSASF